MSVLTITADYDGHAYFDSDSLSYYKTTTGEGIRVGALSPLYIYHYRSFVRFSLADLPAGLTVDNITQVRLYVYCRTAGSASHLTDIHAYNNNGQSDPSVDDAEDCYNRCASGNLYKNDLTDLRTTGNKWFVLNGNINQDIIDAKEAVNRIALALHEEGDDNVYALLDALEKAGGYFIKLEITYIVVVEPTVTTQSAININAHNATLNGTITDTGEEDCDQRGFEWGVQSGVYPNSWTEDNGFGIGSFSHQITDLIRNKTYYYRAKAHNSAGWGYGNEVSFITLLEYPIVTTQDATDIERD